MAASEVAGPSRHTIEYYEAIRKPHRRKRKLKPCICSNLAALAAISSTMPQTAARRSPPSPTYPTDSRAPLQRRGPPDYYEYVDGIWRLSEDWKLNGVKGRRPPASVPTTTTLPEPDAEDIQNDVMPTDYSSMSVPFASASTTFPDSIFTSSPIPSATASATQTALRVSTPAGWSSDRERTPFYAVPLIVLASILLFCSIFGIIGGVSVKRSRKKELAKLKRANDLESSASSDLAGLAGRKRLIALAKRKMRRTKTRIVRGAKRKPVVVIVPSEMLATTRLTASNLDLRQVESNVASTLLRRRYSGSRRSGTSTPAMSEVGGADDSGVEEEVADLEPTSSRTALTNEDAQSTAHSAGGSRRRSFLSRLPGSPSLSGSRRNSQVLSPPAYRTATRAAATPSYAVATGQQAASSSSTSPAPALSPRQSEKARAQQSTSDEIGPSSSPHANEPEEEEEAIDRSAYVAHVATDDKAVLRQMQTLGSAPEVDEASSLHDSGTAPSIELDEEGFEDHSQWLEEHLPPPPSSASTSTSASMPALPAPSRPVDITYDGLQRPIVVASAPPIEVEEIEASAPPMLEWDDEDDGRERHVEV